VTVTAPPPSMTETASAPEAQPSVVHDPSAPGESPPHPTERTAPSSPVRLVVGWLLLTLLGVLVVLLGLSTTVEQRDQRALLGTYRADIESASNQAFGLPGLEAPIDAPSPGSPVAVLDAETTGLHSVAVEGTEPAQTRQGPGHVVGTAGPGQPGNSVVLGRSHLYAAPFASLADMALGDRILVSTVQGQSVYAVRYVGRHEITDAATSSASAAATGAEPTTTPTPTTGDATPAPTGAPPPAPTLPDGPLTPTQLFGPTDDDRLTLVTSDSAIPWSTGEAVVVVARLEGQPFAPTPQGGRTVEGDGRHADPGILAPLLLAALLMLVAVVAAVWLHRSVPWRSAYLLSAPLLVAATILLAEQIAGTMPAWT
jgi:sortase A